MGLPLVAGGAPALLLGLLVGAAAGFTLATAVAVALVVVSHAAPAVLATRWRARAATGLLAAAPALALMAAHGATRPLVALGVMSLVTGLACGPIVLLGRRASHQP